MSTALSSKWYGKTKEMLRCRRINPQMPGYNLLLCGICELAADEGMTEEELYDLDQTDICVMNYKIINFQMCEAYFKNKRIDTEQQLRKTIRLYSIDEFSQMGDDLEQCQEMLKKVLNESTDESVEAKG